MNISGQHLCCPLIFSYQNINNYTGSNGVSLSVVGNSGLLVVITSSASNLIISSSTDVYFSLFTILFIRPFAVYGG